MTFSRFVVIAGLSGAGKSQAMKCFEDLGFHCSDNLPPALLGKFVSLARAGGIEDLAVSLDVRTRGAFGEAVAALDDLKNSGAAFELVYFEADDATLLRRYSETRRRHPLETEAGSLSEAIERERRDLLPLRELATRIVDTTEFEPARIKKLVRSEYAGDAANTALPVRVVAFGFKFGLPPDADLVFDVRFLTNPNYVPHLRPLTGSDAPIAKFLEALPETGPFLERLFALVDFVVPRFLSEGRARLTIAIGCTGGRHRSVYVAGRLAEHLQKTDGITVALDRRELAAA